MQACTSLSHSDTAEKTKHQMSPLGVKANTKSNKPYVVSQVLLTKCKLSPHSCWIERTAFGRARYASGFRFDTKPKLNTDALWENIFYRKLICWLNVKGPCRAPERKLTRRELTLGESG